MVCALLGSNRKAAIFQNPIIPIKRRPSCEEKPGDGFFAGIFHASLGGPHNRGCRIVDASADGRTNGPSSPRRSGECNSVSGSQGGECDLDETKYSGWCDRGGSPPP